jgi:hypothetical protein
VTVLVFMDAIFKIGGNSLPMNVLFLWSLTFEVTCTRQRDALARQGIMSIARHAGQVWHAVARQVHRRVRFPQNLLLGTDLLSFHAMTALGTSVIECCIFSLVCIAINLTQPQLQKTKQ